MIKQIEYQFWSFSQTNDDVVVKHLRLQPPVIFFFKKGTKWKLSRKMVWTDNRSFLHLRNSNTWRVHKQEKKQLLPTSGQNLNLFWLKPIFPPLICVPGKIKGDVNKHLFSALS